MGPPGPLFRVLRLFAWECYRLLFNSYLNLASCESTAIVIGLQSRGVAPPKDKTAYFARGSRLIGRPRPRTCLLFDKMPSLCASLRYVSLRSCRVPRVPSCPCSYLCPCCSPFLLAQTLSRSSVSTATWPTCLPGRPPWLTTTAKTTSGVCCPRPLLFTEGEGTGGGWLSRA